MTAETQEHWEEKAWTRSGLSPQGPWSQGHQEPSPSWASLLRPLLSSPLLEVDNYNHQSLRSSVGKQTRLHSSCQWKCGYMCSLLLLSLLFSHSVVSNSLWPHGLQHNRLPCPSPSLRVCSNSCPLSRWHHRTIPSSVILSPAFNLSQHLGLFQWITQVAKILECLHQRQSFQWIFRIDFLEDCLVGSPCCPRDSQESSPAPQFKCINSSALSLLCSPTLTSIHDSWKNHSFQGPLSSK